MSRKPKGSVNLTNNNGTIRLRWSYLSKPFNLSLQGLRFDNKEHLKVAKAKASEIESDIIYGRFDSTLVKYDPRKKTLVEVAPDPLDQLSLSLLWEKYTRYRSSVVEETTIRTHYRRVAGHIDRLSTGKLSQALEIRQEILDGNSLQTSKFLLMQINAACDWGVNNRLIPFSPFLKMASEISVPDDDSDVDPFSQAERDTILQAFGEHRTYRFYRDFVWFLFFSGCRTSEAVALKWKHVDSSFRNIQFREAVVNVSSKKIAKGTKTGKVRSFPANSQMQEFLNTLCGKRKPQSRDDFLFPSLKGRSINSHTFSALCWKGSSQHGVWKNGIITQLVEDELIDHYRNLYSTRHSFITYNLYAGVPVHLIAKWCGNSPEIVLKNYAGVLPDSLVPEL